MKSSFHRTSALSIPVALLLYGAARAQSLEQKLIPGSVFGAGAAVDVDGNTGLVVGAGYSASCGCSATQGIVYVRAGTSWTEQARVELYTGTGNEIPDAALAGDELLLSADAYTNDLAQVEHYSRSGTTWTDVGNYLNANLQTALGNAVAIDGNRFAFTDDYGSLNSRVYVHGPTNWTLEQGLAPAGGIALRGDLLVLTSNPAPYWGPPCKVRVYHRSGSVWSVIATPLTFGAGRYPVKIDEERAIAVGDPKDSTAGANAGAVYLLRAEGSTWVLWQKLLSPNFPGSAGFGAEIAFEGGTLAVGCGGEDIAATDAGAVYFYRRNGGWTQQPVLLAPDAALGDRFGDSVALNGNTLVVGAPLDDDAGMNSGSAYVFHIDSAATVYCTAKANSLGCLPRLDFTGTPSASSTSSFTISARQVLNNKVGVFFYGLTGGAATALPGGYRCVGNPVKRTGTQSSGGNPGPSDCSGVNSIDFNARIQSGVDPNLVAGVQVNAQCWTRDGGVSGGTLLTDAIEFVIQP
jgi:hypothetical protein